MGGCSAIYCSNHSGNGFRMFRFPTDPRRRRIWVRNCRRGDWEPGSQAQLCSMHFEDSQFESAVSSDARRKLKQDAVPTIFHLLPPFKSSGISPPTTRPEGVHQPTTLLPEPEVSTPRSNPSDEDLSGGEEPTGPSFFDLPPEGARSPSRYTDRKVDYAELQLLLQKMLLRKKEMAPKVDDADILNKIQGTYVPFLKKLIAFLEKNKKATPENLTKLRAIYTIFTTANPREQIETFHANQKKLENWYNKAQKDKHSEDGDVSKGSKRSFTCSDTESSQGACDTTQPVSKKSCTFADAVEAQPSILKVQSVADIKQEVKEKEKEVEKEKEKEEEGPIVFTCASCQFQTREEADFMKHARTDHRTDLSMWCKRCGKCFSNAGVLVSHIKERACVHEEMVYRCGVKECVFETGSGQTFVHHLRHCHKGSPFIFCVHCQKIFTLPHCLILHMQDDCPFKDKNRRGKAGAAPVATPQQQPPPPVTPAPLPPKPVSVLPAKVIAPARPPQPVNHAPPVRGGGGRGRSFRGGRGRAKSRARISDSSDSDDPDDPSWRPDESLGETGLRRSGRWAKKVNDVMEPTAEPSTSSKRTFPSTQMVHCPCCDFMAAFDSVLEDHYIANHKMPNKNSCLVCRLKFENTRSFLEHFDEHRKGVLPNGPPPVVEQKEEPPAPPPKQQTRTEIEIRKETEPKNEVNDDPDSVLTGPEGASFMQASVCRSGSVKIPYQSAIHDRNLKDGRLGKFEELKSPSDLLTMKAPDKLRHFYRCALYACAFTTDRRESFENHLRTEHEGKRYHCCYCPREDASSHALAEHMVSEHGRRMFQCSACFYRACSATHLRVHAENVHPKDDVHVLECKAERDEDKDEDGDEPTTWPFLCGIGACDYSTNDPREFRRHNETVHRTASVYFCFYCKVDFLTFKRLTNHYRLHGINQYQCRHCVHGAETKEEVMAHLCAAHPDKPMRAFRRGGEGEATASAAHKPEQQKQSAPSTEEEEKLLYQVIDNACYPAHMLRRRYPRYLRRPASDLVCGVPDCGQTFVSLDTYARHLRSEHHALNLPCPHCPEMCNAWEDFRNHLLCHASKLYACGAKGCTFYAWNKEAVKGHAKIHDGEEEPVPPGPVAIREFAALEEEETLLHAASEPSKPEEGDGAYACAFCGLRSWDKRSMKNHLYREMGYRRFECALCGERCASRREAKEHFGAAHPEQDVICVIEPNFELEAVVRAALGRPKIAFAAKTCDACCGRFGDTRQCQAHLRLCLRKEDRPHECGRCGRGFAALLSLRHHWDEEHNAERPFEFSHAHHDAVEEDVEGNLLRVRLRQLKEALDGECLEEVPRKIKFYACGECPFESQHKYNVQRHGLQKHGSTVEVMKGVESGGAGSAARRFACGLCAKKASSRHEVERHARRAHPREDGRFYYLSPSAEDEDDGRIYDCAYCKSTREALPVLRKHADLLHADTEFKVKGKVGPPETPARGLACGHCYRRFAGGASELSAHSASAHPQLAPKCLGEEEGTAKRKSAEDAGSASSGQKRVRFGGRVFVCRHCGGAFGSEEQASAHSRRAHSRLPALYDATPGGGGGGGDESIRFYKCEFCRFTSERRFLERHLSSKHKMRVTCRHCGRRFEFASLAKEHHEVAHAGLPLSYSHETIGAEEEPSDCGKKPEQLDLESLTVHMETTGGKTANLPLVYVTEHFDLFPRVLVRDVMKN